MKRAILLSCLALAGLASCSIVESQTKSGAAPSNPKQIAVGVAGGGIQVQELTTVAASNGALIWELDSATAANFRFPADGVRFEYPAPNAPKICRSTPDPKAAFDNCRPIANGARFECSKKGHVSGTCYKYTVTLQRTTPGTGVPPKDPWIANE
jgi:hypothetical protein